jgi:hypothetical protein
MSEVMHDLGLTVGVASIGNDPHWLDGGAAAQHPCQWRRDAAVQGYWMDYAFGALGAMVEARREALSAMLPGLAIAARCRIADRFLHVEGKEASFRIHFGSAAVFDTREDRRLPLSINAGAAVRRPALQLGLQDDATLSLILAKAFALAAK